METLSWFRHSFKTAAQAAQEVISRCFQATRQSPGRGSRQRQLTWKLGLTIAIVFFLVITPFPTAFCATDRSDKAALLSFKAGLTQTNGLLDTWTPQTDPCGDKWSGLSCTCQSTVGQFTNCMQAKSPQRVLQLNVPGSKRKLPTGSSARLVGTISPHLSSLTELRLWSMHGNRLTGPMPLTLGSLANLEYVDLSDNRLSGELPSWAGALSQGKTVRLDANNFTGPYPAAWCPPSPPTYNILLSNNQGLCNSIPECLKKRIPSTGGTASVTVASAVGSSRRLYQSSQESCELVNCGIIVGTYNTNLTSIYFQFAAFNPFTQQNSSINQSRINYFWGLGTAPFKNDVLPAFPVNKTNAVIGTVATQAGGNVTIALYTITRRLNGVAFINHQDYYITLTATSIDFPSLSRNFTSKAIRTDTDPPFLPRDAAVDNTVSYMSIQTTTVTDSMAGSWDDFEDPESGIRDYQIQIREIIDDAAPGALTQYNNITQLVDVGLATSGVAKGLNLQINHMYVVLVNATNGAGLSSAEMSTPLQIVGKPNSVTSSSAAIIAAAVIGICGVLVALITVFIVRTRYNARRKARREQRRQIKELKGLMYGLVSSDTGGDPLQKSMDRIVDSRQLCFVTTDLEASTAQASTDHKAFLQVQDIHDTVMREGIAKHGGYEIITEGDAFQVAFISVHQAVLFCEETQYRLLESVWPYEVLKLPSCNEELDAFKQPLFRGPRVRMGIHWALEGTFMHRLHNMTKHRVFSGPGFQLAQKIGDVASGGQVIMTHPTWLQLCKGMDQAGFPTVENLGQFKLDEWPAPLWIYQVTHLLGKPLLRVFEPLRRAQQMLPAHGFDIVPPPKPRRLHGTLTICAIRYALEELNLQLADAEDEHAAPALPPTVSSILWHAVAVTAMQFEGYIFKKHDPNASYVLAFANTRDAVRFAHAIQATLMATQWPTESMSFSGATEEMPDGRPIFRGPRMAVAIHETVEYTVTNLEGAVVDLATVRSEQNLTNPVTISGAGEAFARQVVSVAFGGQVILTESAWTTVQDHIPGQAQVVSLGVHVINVDGDASRVLLMEVVPSTLARRTFPSPKTILKLEPGYRDSPDPNHHLALLYLKTSKPKDVAIVEDTADSLSEDLVSDTLTDYNLGLMMIGRTVRALLPAYHGYECKEPELGKFTLAFRNLEWALRWAAALQEDLLDLPWPEALLRWASAAEVPGSGGRPQWRGLRVGIGIAWGGSTYRKPLNTGRADYFGNLPNLAARLSAIAAPGQIILDGNGVGSGNPDYNLASRSDSVIMLPPLSEMVAESVESSGGSSQGIFSTASPPAGGTLGPPTVTQHRPTDLAGAAEATSRRVSSSTVVDVAGIGGEGVVQLTCLGHFRLKGIEKPQRIWQAMPLRLVTREFPVLPNRVSDRSDFLADIGRRSTGRRSTWTGSSFIGAAHPETSHSADAGGRQYFTGGKRIGRRLTTGSFLPFRHRDRHNGSGQSQPSPLAAAPTHSSTSSFADWHSSRATSQHNSITLPNDGFAKRSDEERESSGGLQRVTRPVPTLKQSSQMQRQSSGTIDQNVHWSDAEATGMYDKEHPYDVDNSFTSAPRGRLAHSHSQPVTDAGGDAWMVRTGFSTSPPTMPSLKPKRPRENGHTSRTRSTSEALKKDVPPTDTPPVRGLTSSQPAPWDSSADTPGRGYIRPEDCDSYREERQSPAHAEPSTPRQFPPALANGALRDVQGSSPFARQDQQTPLREIRPPSAKDDGRTKSGQRASVDFATSPTVIPNRVSSGFFAYDSSSSLAGPVADAAFDSVSSASLPAISSPIPARSPALRSQSVEGHALSTEIARLHHSSGIVNGSGGSKSENGSAAYSDFRSTTTLSDFGAAVAPDAGGSQPSEDLSLPRLDASRSSSLLQQTPSMGRHARELAETFISQVHPEGNAREASRTSRRQKSRARSATRNIEFPRTDSGHLSQEEVAALQANSSTAGFPYTGRRASFRRMTQS